MFYHLNVDVAMACILRDHFSKIKNKVFWSSSNIAFNGPDWMLSFKLLRLSGSIGKFWVF
jgi:hypothetical protein